MAQSRNHETENIFFVNPLRVFLHQKSAKLLCQMSNTDGVLKTVVSCIGKDPVNISQLLQVPEPLELLCINYAYADRGQFDVTVYTASIYITLFSYNPKDNNYRKSQKSGEFLEMVPTSSQASRAKKW